MIQILKTKLVEKNKLTSDVFEFVFEILEQKDIEFKAGQFMMLQVPVEGSFPQKRAYSLANSPSLKGKMRFCIRYLDNGVASTYLKNLQIAQDASFQGPFGRFTVNENCQKNLLFVATGTGLAPFYGIIEDLFEKKFQHKIELFFGLRYLSDLFYVDILEKFAKEHSNFSYKICISRPESDCKYFKGRVTDYIDFQKYTKENTEIYTCGSGAMVTEIKEKFLAQGFEKGQVHEELFYI